MTCFATMYNFFLCLYFVLYVESVAQGKLEQYYSWKQIGYDFNGVKYLKDSDYLKKPGPVIFKQELNDSEKYFIQYNNIPIGFAVTDSREVFISVPRRRHGIPSTLNSVSGRTPSSPLLQPFPDPGRSQELVSVYRPQVDLCNRLWMVDTGLLEVPDARRQVQPPSIVVYDLSTKRRDRILRYQLKPTDLVNNRTSGGLTSITVDVDPKSCGDAYAYINDLATESLVVFSLRQMNSWSFHHPSFRHEESSLNFTVAGHTIGWRDGLFSTTLVPGAGGRKLFFHPLVSTKEFSVSTDALKIKGNTDLPVMLEGDKGPNTQSGTHAYHAPTRTILYANVAQDAILCWNVDQPLTPENVGVVAQDHEKIVYISDLKVLQDEVWVLVNQIPRFVFSSLDVHEDNFFLHKGNIRELIKGTPCEK